MAFWKSNLALNSSEYTTMGVNTRLKRADFFPQWVCLVEDISIVQRGIRSHSQTSHIYQVWGLFSSSFLIERSSKTKNWNSEVLTAEDLEDMLVCDRRSQHEEQVGDQPCKVFQSVRVVFILCVYVQHMQAIHNVPSVYYQLYVFHTWGYYWNYLTFFFSLLS